MRELIKRGTDGRLYFWKTRALGATELGPGWIDPRLLPELFAPSEGAERETSYAGLAIADTPQTMTPTDTPGRYALGFGIPDPSALLRAAAVAEGFERLRIEDLPTLVVGDQVLIRREIRGPITEWAIAFLIRVATHTRRDKRPSVVNHNATVIRPIYAYEGDVVEFELGAGISAGPCFVHAGPVVDYEIAEALGRGGFQYSRLIESYGNARKYSIAVTRHALATDAHRAKMLAAAESLIGRSYGYAKVGAHALDYGLTAIWQLAGGRNDVFAFRWLCRMERYPMCSWASLFIYRKGGLRFSTSLETGSPDDLYDEMRRKAGTIWSWLFVSPRIRDEVFGPGYGDLEGGRV